MKGVVLAGGLGTPVTANTKIRWTGNITTNSATHFKVFRIDPAPALEPSPILRPLRGRSSNRFGTAGDDVQDRTCDLRCIARHSTVSVPCRPLRPRDSMRTSIRPRDAQVIAVAGIVLALLLAPASVLSQSAPLDSTEVLEQMHDLQEDFAYDTTSIGR